MSASFFHCSRCSIVPPNHSSVRKIPRFFTDISGIIGIFLILALIWPSLPPSAMITMVCLGSIFVTSALVFEIINYFVKVKRQKKEEEVIQSEFEIVQKVIDKFKIKGGDPFLHFKNTAFTIKSYAQNIIRGFHISPLKNNPLALELLQKYPIDKEIFSMTELLKLKNDMMSFNHKYFTALRDENSQRCCSLASMCPPMQHIENLNYEVRLFYEKHQISQDTRWDKLADATKNAYIAYDIALDQYWENKEKIPLSLLFHYIKEQEKQMVAILKKIGIK